MTTSRICLFLLAPFIASAHVVIVGPIEDLFTRSDLVCQGTVSSETQLTPDAINAQGKLLPNDYSALINVRSCYKGILPTGGLRLSFTSVDPMWGKPLPIGPIMLLFVTKQPNGLYKLTDASSVLPFWDTPSVRPERESGIAQIES